MMKDTSFPAYGNVVVYIFSNRDVTRHLIGQLIDRSYGDKKISKLSTQHELFLK